MKKSTCHPNKKVFSSGLCSSCYQKEWRQKNLEHFRKRDRIRSKEDRKKHPEEWKRRARESYQRHRLKRIVYQKIKNYGITAEQYWSMLKKRNGVCDICNRKFEQLYVDHCHKTKIIRGMLCQKCNQALGMFNDDTKIMKKAIKYLNVYKKI